MAGLAGSGKQVAVLGPEVDRAVGVAVDEAAYPDVHQDPLGVDRIDYPEGVIQALSPAPVSYTHLTLPVSYTHLTLPTKA